VLFLVIAWIPTDFGLGLYTGHLALNASREGARIAAADGCLLGTTSPAGRPCVIPGIAVRTGSCTLPCSAEQSADPNGVLAQTASRLSSALLPNAQITVTYPVAGGTTCNRQVEVQVSGDYNFFFYRLLRLLAGNAAVPTNSVNIFGSTDMRWEHQSAC